MLLEPTSDQEFFAETTAKYLAERVPVDELRRLRSDPDGFDRDYWSGGGDLGWAALLAGDESISGEPLVDLSLIAYEFGRHAAPGPLVPVNVVAAALRSAGGHDDVVDALMAGAAIAAWGLAEPPPGDHLGQITLDVRLDGGDVVLNGVKRPVEHAGQADHLLVSGRTGDGLTQVLLAASEPGVSIEPMRAVDVTRRFATVRLTDVRVPVDAVVGEVGGAAAQIAEQVRRAVTLTCAEMLGAMQAGFDMTVEWSFDRYSFGRPLASYQALKHRFADMLCWLEAGKALCVGALAAIGARADDADERASAAKSFIGDYGAELLQDCVQLHGGIGLTFEHDLHLFLRRLTVDRALYGTPAEHRQRIVGFMEERTRA